MHGRPDEANASDAVLFCSGRGTRKKMQDESFLSAFSLDENKQFIGAIDSGALLLGALGLLRGKRATSYPSAEVKFVARARLCRTLGVSVLHRMRYFYGPSVRRLES